MPELFPLGECGPVTAETRSRQIAFGLAMRLPICEIAFELGMAKNDAIYAAIGVLWKHPELAYDPRRLPCRRCGRR